MRIVTAIIAAAIFSTPAFADDRALITQQEQEMADAIASGNAAVWDKYLDAGVIYAEEDDSFKGKAEMLKEIVPLPKGLGGEIKIVLLSYAEDGDTATALFRQVETEHYFGQTIHANYLTNTVWKKRADGWKQIEGQVLAERTDPPSMAAAPAQLVQYTGAYKLKDSDPVTTLTVTGGKLMGVRGTHAPAEWKQEAPDVFFIPGDNRIRKIFQRDAEGHITGFIERRESWDIVWVKQ
jgi:ketosteroid isomerase-like protein